MPPMDPNRLFLVEQVGKIWILKDGLLLKQPFLDIEDLISPGAVTQSFSEQGLLGLAFHPEFQSNGAFFINYTDRQGSTVVARYQVDAENPDIADLSSGEILFLLSQPYANHNGGHIEFGPDGYLYIALGDGGSANDPLGAGQNRQLLLGSILRIDVDSDAPYAIPPDNPFVGDASARAEIWAYGLRNVWRFTFDRATGDLYMADVGQNQWEEINFQPADSAGGENYGWNVWEGKHIFAGGSAPNHVPPIYEYSHSFGCSVTGGNIYRVKPSAMVQRQNIANWAGRRAHDRRALARIGEVYVIAVYRLFIGLNFELVQRQNLGIHYERFYLAPMIAFASSGLLGIGKRRPVRNTCMMKYTLIADDILLTHAGDNSAALAIG